MTLRFLLDTNTVSALLWPSVPPQLPAKIEAHDGECAIASVVSHELRCGCDLLPPSRRRSALEAFLHDVVRPSFEMLDYDDRAADWHATERARLVRAGLTPAFVEGQIAAVARVNGLTLITDNIKDFSKFAELRVESWLAPQRRPSARRRRA